MQQDLMSLNRETRCLREEAKRKGSSRRPKSRYRKEGKVQAHVPVLVLVGLMTQGSRKEQKNRREWREFKK